LFAKYGDPDFDDIPGTIAVIAQTSDYAAFKAALDSDFDPATNPKSELMKTLIFYGTPIFNSSYYLAKLGLSHQDPFHFDYYTQDFITDETDELNLYMIDKFEPFLDKEFNVSGCTNSAFWAAR